MFTPAELVAELRKRKYERSFRPFELETIDGTKYPIFGRFAYASNDKWLTVHDEKEHGHQLRLIEVKSINDLNVGVR